MSPRHSFALYPRLGHQLDAALKYSVAAFVIRRKLIDAEADESPPDARGRFLAAAVAAVVVAVAAVAASAAVDQRRSEGKWMNFSVAAFVIAVIGGDFFDAVVVVVVDVASVALISPSL